MVYDLKQGDSYSDKEVARLNAECGALQNSLQQLKAEIAALANELELIPGTGFMVGKRVDVLAKMRQLSAI